MTLHSRLARLEAGSTAVWLTGAECDAAATRYAEVHAATHHLFPDAMTPAAYRHALTNSRHPDQQRLLACMIPGDDDI